MRVQLEVAGHAVHFVTVNRADGVESQEKLIKKCAFPLLQDTDELGIWAQMDGGKDDFYVFDAEGNLHTYFEYGGDMPTNLSEAEGYDAVKDAILSALGDAGPLPSP